MNPESNIGRVLDGKYEVQALIGSGGMGAVYRARHRLIDRDFALKLLHSEYASDRDTVKRFEREATTTAALGHDNIVEVTDMGVTEEGELFIVMELLAGVELSAVLGRAGQVSQGWACHVVVQILGALEAVHGMNIVHRDLKPGNVFLVEHPGMGDFVKLMDFGIAKVRTDEKGLTRGLTRTGQLLGTPWYMSPEQARGETTVTHAADIYAIGVILYQMVTGELPFTGKSYVEVLMKILTEDAADPILIRPGLESGLREAILRAMSKEEGDRFADVVEFRAAIEQFADPGASVDKPLSSLVLLDRVSTPVDLVNVRESGAATPARFTTPLELPKNTPTPAPAAVSARPLRVVRILAAGAVLLAACAVGWYFWQGGAPPEDHSPPGPVQAARAIETPSRTDVVSSKARAETQGKLRIMVEPAGAVVRVDGNPAVCVDGVVDIPVDGLSHRLEISAEGYEPYSRIVLASEPRKIVVKLSEPARSEKRKDPRNSQESAPVEGDLEADPAPPDVPPETPPPPPSKARGIDEEDPW